MATTESVDTALQTPTNEGVDFAGSVNEGDQSTLTARKRPMLDDEVNISSPPLKRFTVVSSDDKNKWFLPQDMAEYANEHMQTFIPEKDVTESIMLPNGSVQH